MTRLHHVAVIVADLDAAVKQMEALGLRCTSRHRLEAARIEVAILPQGDSELHLIEPIGHGGAPYEFLAQHGPATHHLCFEVDDSDSELDSLGERGFGRSMPRPVAVGRGIADIFITPQAQVGFSDSGANRRTPAKTSTKTQSLG